jgi:hypothetical protein
MTYRNLHHAFLFEAVVGLLALLTVVVFGKYGVFLLIVLSIRPLILKRFKEAPDQRVWRLYFRVFILALFLTAFAILATSFVVDVRWDEPQGIAYLSLLALPWFVLAHGVGGYLISNSNQQVGHKG